MSDLFSQVKEEKVPSSAESVNPEYLFGPAGKKKEKAAKKTSTANAPISSPTTFFVSRGDKSKQGLGRDVHIDSVDISIGSKCLVKNSYLKLTHGRRYGLVGRNGMGKSTLLRYISGRELRGIPDHLQILHVEQEVIGDDVSVLDTVLSSDVERLALLDEEKELLAKHKTASEEEQKELDTRLSKVYADLADIASDEAESKARLILGGLGFTSEMQKQATKEFSGGWRMRVSLARALFCTPDILLLDEPTNMLGMYPLNVLLFIVASLVLRRLNRRSRCTLARGLLVQMEAHALGRIPRPRFLERNRYRYHSLRQTGAHAV
jgi:ABC-type dipeptide/oligopeptide/nickel transport system ATPase subunit